MGKETVLFSSEERLNRTEICGFLRRLAEKIETGSVTLRQGGEEIILEMPSQMVLDIKVEDEQKRSKGVQHSLEIELKWWPRIEAKGAGGVSLG